MDRSDMLVAIRSLREGKAADVALERSIIRFTLEHTR